MFSSPGPRGGAPVYRCPDLVILLEEEPVGADAARAPAGVPALGAAAVNDKLAALTKRLLPDA